MTPWKDLWRAFGRIGLLSFGGPAAQIALMHRELVDDRKWLTEQEYLRALSFCMLLPGPEAMQLATYAGWKLRGIPGGLLAGLLFVLPGACVIFLLAALYVALADVSLVDAIFVGIKACVVVIVIEALLRVSRRALKSNVHRLIALVALVAIFFLDIPFPVIILAAALTGAGLLTQAEPSSEASFPPHRGLWGVLIVGLALWFAPIVVLWASGSAFLLSVGLFFSKLAVVTFGGAYAVLAYMAQAVVETYGWVTTAQMMDALGLAETTPGPLILVTQFIAYLAGHGQGGSAMAIAAAGLTLWVTFVPCFLWIFAFAPYVDWLGSRPRLSAALAGVTAAVVGVIANLALVFAIHVFFGDTTWRTLGPIRIPAVDLSMLRWTEVAIAVAAGIALLRLHWNLLVVLALCALAGAAMAGLG